MRYIQLILMLFFLSGYWDGSTIKTDPPNSITASGPMTISRNSLFPIINKEYYLNVRMIEGSYSEDWSPGPLMGRTWKGKFQIIVTDEYEKIISTLNLNEFFQDELIFNSTFDIEFDDYNGDGNIDFTIGQYGTSNGNFYKLFTLTQENQIQELKIHDYNDLFISGGTSRYSTKLEKINKTTFKKSFYNNATGKNVEDTFEWNGTEFVRTSQVEK
ncbi:hypothetical protein E0485_04970 [Paenibacillus albiflavus]|uniref:VCBS repeat-containing protein n=1 Tax=Paenibacillus albiflavus TaxID=2545760 RepID=A0A4R4ENT1_9BACL|nr:hypothetical protein [Paenibacillus albiflavus]TCZ80201.1 hypothetical protein E0485_04970 [Paenibacillus albiflavus]